MPEHASLSAAIVVEVMNHEWRGRAQWARISSIGKIHSHEERKITTQEISKSSLCFENVKIVEICHRTIDQPKPLAETEMHNTAIVPPSDLPSVAVMWDAYGHRYSTEEAAAVHMVQIVCNIPATSTALSSTIFEEFIAAIGPTMIAGDHASTADRTTTDDVGNGKGFNALGKMSFYIPADKVFRLRALLEPNPDELEIVRMCVQSRSAPRALILPSHPDLTAGPIEIVSPRSGFVAAAGWVLMAVDYAQIELRILTHFCEDVALLKSFRDERVDVFKAICARWKKKPLDSVMKTERDAVKQLCYALIYGAGASRIAAVVNCSETEAKVLYQDFLKSHPGITKFISAVKRDCRKCGYVTTILGRRRQLKDICSANKSLQAKAERQAVNTICQGSAADLIKVQYIFFSLIPDFFVSLPSDLSLS